MMLVAYFSASGRTARLAQTIAQAAQADLYEIRPAQPYTSADLNWHDAHSRSSVEMKDPACRPAIAGDLPDLSRYDTIFVGFPNMRARIGMQGAASTWRQPACAETGQTPGTYCRQ